MKEQERVGQEVQQEVEMRMRKADKEEESYRELVHNTETNLRVGVIIRHTHACKSATDYTKPGLTEAHPHQWFWLTILGNPCTNRRFK